MDSPAPPPGSEAHESQSLQSDRPPLAAGLFRQRFARSFRPYQICHGLFPQLDAEARNQPGIEAFLDRLAVPADADAFVRQQLTALRYYIAAIIGSCVDRWLEVVNETTNYAVLLDQIDDWRRRTGERVLLVTFNYDRLLERAATSILPCFDDLKVSGFTEIQRYVSRDEYKLLKLHGSTTWARISPGAPATYPTDEYLEALRRADAGWLKLEDCVTTDQAQKYDLRHFSRVPAIAIPVQGKADFECPPAHVNALVDGLRETDKLLIVGWKGMEQNLTRLLHESGRLQHVLIVDAGDGGKITEAQLREIGQVKAPIDHFAHGFSAFLRSRRLRAFFDVYA